MCAITLIVLLFVFGYLLPLVFFFHLLHLIWVAYWTGQPITSILERITVIHDDMDIPHPPGHFDLLGDRDGFAEEDEATATDYSCISDASSNDDSILTLTIETTCDVHVATIFEIDDCPLATSVLDSAEFLAGIRDNSVHRSLDPKASFLKEHSTSAANMDAVERLSVLPLRPVEPKQDSVTWCSEDTDEDSEFTSEEADLSLDSKTSILKEHSMSAANTDAVPLAPVKPKQDSVTWTSEDTNDDFETTLAKEDLFLDYKTSNLNEHSTSATKIDTVEQFSVFSLAPVEPKQDSVVWFSVDTDDDYELTPEEDPSITSILKEHSTSAINMDTVEHLSILSRAPVKAQQDSATLNEHSTNMKTVEQFSVLSRAPVEPKQDSVTWSSADTDDDSESTPKEAPLDYKTSTLKEHSTSTTNMDTVEQLSVLSLASVEPKQVAWSPDADDDDDELTPEEEELLESVLCIKPPYNLPVFACHPNDPYALDHIPTFSRRNVDASVIFPVRKPKALVPEALPTPSSTLVQAQSISVTLSENVNTMFNHVAVTWNKAKEDMKRNSRTSGLFTSMHFSRYVGNAARSSSVRYI